MPDNKVNAPEPTSSVPDNEHTPTSTQTGRREYEKRESGEQAVPAVPAENTGDSLPTPEDEDQSEQEKEKSNHSDDRIGKKIGQINREK